MSEVNSQGEDAPAGPGAGPTEPSIRSWFWIVVGSLIAGAALFWLYDQVILAWQVRGYVAEIGAAFGLNAHLTNAIFIVSLAVVAFCLRLSFSLSKRRRAVGQLALLTLLVGHSLALWSASRLKIEGRCYVVTRTGITYNEHPGLDPATGRPCRPVTNELQERLRAYETGARPTRVTDEHPTFFDPRTGEPVIWFYRDAQGTIELFDLMGFHPLTGEELTPITKEVVAQWQESQRRRVALPTRAPQRIDPARGGFFDPMTGAPRAWYVVAPNGVLEFFDSPGFHPVTGEPLVVVTRSVVDAWQAAAAQAARERAEEARQREQAQRAEAERVARERQEMAERLLQQQRAETEKRQQDKAAAERCDTLAANPNDTRRGATPGAPYEALKLQARDAVEACEAAFAAFPDELRFRYQYARAMQFVDRNKAFELQKANAAQLYPAAFDNLGWLYISLRNDYPAAIRQFSTGAQLGDPDCMVSLAELISTGRYPVDNPEQEILRLYARAAELGHQRAAAAYQETKAALAEHQLQQQQQRAMQEQAIGIFGRILNGVPRR